MPVDDSASMQRSSSERRCRCTSKTTIVPSTSGQSSNASGEASTGAPTRISTSKVPSSSASRSEISSVDVRPPSPGVSVGQQRQALLVGHAAPRASRAARRPGGRRHRQVLREHRLGREVRPREQHVPPGAGRREREVGGERVGVGACPAGVVTITRCGPTPRRGQHRDAQPAQVDRGRIGRVRSRRVHGAPSPRVGSSASGSAPTRLGEARAGSPIARVGALPEAARCRRRRWRRARPRRSAAAPATGRSGRRAGRPGGSAARGSCRRPSSAELDASRLADLADETSRRASAAVRASVPDGVPAIVASASLSSRSRSVCWLCSRSSARAFTASAVCCRFSRYASANACAPRLRAASGLDGRVRDVQDQRADRVLDREVLEQGRRVGRARVQLLRRELGDDGRVEHLGLGAGADVVDARLVERPGEDRPDHDRRLARVLRARPPDVHGRERDDDRPSRARSCGAGDAGSPSSR